MSLCDNIKKARGAGVPLLLIETSDPAAVQAIVLKCSEVPVLRWDMVRGVNPCNEEAKVIANTMTGGDPTDTARPDAMLESIEKMSEDSILLLYGAEKIMDEVFVRQGLWNLRDDFKTTGRTLVAMVPLGTKLTSDLRDDFVVLEHPLPTQAELRKATISLVEDAELEPLSDADLDKAIDATLGLSGFGAETCLAMSLGKGGVDQDALWERKRKAIEATQGLTVYRGTEKFDDLGGLDNAKDLYRQVAKSKKYAPRCVVFIDEIEKAISGLNDSTGVNKAQLGAMLKWMQNKDIDGGMLIGVAGSGKSAIGKAIGNEAQCPTIEFDLDGMKGSLVGSSEANLRAAMATVDAIGQDRILIVATCNAMGEIPVELKRRFKLSTMFFDLPSKIEREGIWKLYLSKFDMVGATLPDDTDWTGAEIRTCCQLADRLEISLVEASTYIVPVAKSGAKAIDTLRREASGNYISASHKGVYEMNTKSETKTGRKITV
tara:strand:+ start:411 stop:1877 length:1467 start_codon:yes stop_codon:yes gene_type:complete